MTSPEEIEEEETEEESAYLEICNGSLIIFDLDKFIEETGARAIQVTDEGSVFIINRSNEIEAIPLVTKRNTKFKSV